MKQSNPQQREEILQRLRQPGAPSVAVISEETGVPKATLYYWLSRRPHGGTLGISSQEGHLGKVQPHRRPLYLFSSPKAWNSLRILFAPGASSKV